MKAKKECLLLLSSPAAADALLMAPLKPWKTAPLLLAVLCLGFLLLQLMPASFIRHPIHDASDTWTSVNPKRSSVGVASSLLLDDISQNLSEKEQGMKAMSMIASQGALGTNGKISEETMTPGAHIFLCTDDMDIRPLIVVINSTIINSREPHQIHFHIVAPEKGHMDWLIKLKTWFPDVNIDLVRLETDLQLVSRHISFRSDSKAREELASPYNFLPFYLPHIFKQFERIIYLDSDVVVKGDIQELNQLDLEGKAVAAVEDCSQMFKIYFNFDLLTAILEKERRDISWLPYKLIEPNTCIFNRGVLLIDVKRWIHENLTEAIEWWMGKFREAEKPLYKYGLSQPPFLLALYRKYKKLEVTWNVRGLGRNEFSEIEREYMKTVLSKKPARRPFLAPLADGAKVLHFNGKYKPWKRNRLSHPNSQPVSLCGLKAIDCAELWWHYLSPVADASLKPIDKYGLRTDSNEASQRTQLLNDTAELL
ncbi:hypothetical protein O6H91_05G107200 [Diphasiastrum complanatum]|uniref:Uncharacterized protein n=1 Tax=Diphasiastrum complanatum TaxID=34168 RepID=A0ACC2DRY9_DIPCM|nr:hypothetical protein O6H91_Y330000 [Diphasiastrum complanatum]KAJ7556983.1 hypothetical protein O6H91_05G107200 [Diphasiastrum complanatum]